MLLGDSDVDRSQHHGLMTPIDRSFVAASTSCAIAETAVFYDNGKHQLRCVDILFYITNLFYLVNLAPNIFRAKWEGKVR
jgi:hypothetical protein